MEAIRVHLPEDLRMNDDEFVRFCQENPDLKFERRKNGDIVFMANTGGESGNKNFELSVDFGIVEHNCFTSSIRQRLSAYPIPLSCCPMWLVLPAPGGKA